MPSAAILAGGRARRFGGRDKRLLAVNGRTMVDRQIDVLSQVSDDVLMVLSADGCAPVGAAGPKEPARVRIARDRMADRGPLGGLDAALAAARHPELVVLACDMPFVSARFLEYLLSLVQGFDAVVPKSERGYHPLCAVYTNRCRAAVERNLAAGHLAMTTLIGQLRVREVGASEIEMFGSGDELLTNVNTPGELAELEALPGHKP
jgi:molybdopterin-guanine dinucleotide biosynthesis protein A